MALIARFSSSLYRAARTARSIESLISRARQPGGGPLWTPSQVWGMDLIKRPTLNDLFVQDVGALATEASVDDEPFSDGERGGRFVQRARIKM